MMRTPLVPNSSTCTSLRMFSMIRCSSAGLAGACSPPSAAGFWGAAGGAFGATFGGCGAFGAAPSWRRRRASRARTGAICRPTATCPGPPASTFMPVPAAGPRSMARRTSATRSARSPGAATTNSSRASSTPTLNAGAPVRSGFPPGFSGAGR